MFMVGLEIDTGLLKRNSRNAFAISISAMAAPFLLVRSTTFVLVIYATT
jgi:Kef-type K+ transport system membrane component KefB